MTFVPVESKRRQAELMALRISVALAELPGVGPITALTLAGRSWAEMRLP